MAHSLSLKKKNLEHLFLTKNYASIINPGGNNSIKEYICIRNSLNILDFPWFP